MSLRIFHIVFITLSTLLAFGLSAWEYGNYRAFGGGHLWGALLAAGCGLILITYGIWFWKKARRLIL